MEIEESQPALGAGSRIRTTITTGYLFPLGAIHISCVQGIYDDDDDDDDDNGYPLFHLLLGVR